MKPTQPLRVFLPALVAMSMLASHLSAHPGHNHNDLPAVIRHPFAGVEHAAVIGALAGVIAAAVIIGVKAWRASSKHAARSRTVRVR